MAQRFYFEFTGASAINPDFTACWDNTANAIRRVMTTQVQNGTTLTSVTTPTLAEDEAGDFLLWQGVYALPGIGTIAAQNTKLQIRASQTTLFNNLFVAWLAKIVASNGTTVRGYLIGSDSAPRLDETETATSLTNRGDAATCSAVSWQAGDYLVVELGLSTAGADSGTGSINIGTSGASDLPEDSSTTTALDPWVEFTGLNLFNAVKPVIVRQATMRSAVR